MASPVGAIVCGGLALALIVGVSAPLAQQPTSPVAAPAGVPRPDQFVGVWDYNPDESTNAATGKPEQDPKSATQRSLAAARPSAPPPPDNTGRGPTRSVGSAAGGPETDDPTGAFRGWAAAWVRSAARDLLEVPERLKIMVSTDAITIADDLDRARTYPTDGKKRKYQLGSAVFEAKASWEGSRLRKDIEAVNQFRMTETYFVSDDGSRLFVIIRLGDPAKAKNAPAVGVNRVYDRVQR